MRQCVNTVGVLNKGGIPLSPTRPSRARWLLKNKKAEVVSVLPFVIRLTYQPKETIVPESTLVLDDGETFGLSLDEHCQTHDRTVLGAYGKTRGREVSDNLKERKSLRSGRRNRKAKRTGHEREVRIAYRRVSEYPQSIRTDVQEKINAVKDVLKYFPVSKIILEPVKIDLVKKMRPGVKGKEYQQGPASCVEAENKHQKKRLAILKRDGYKCLYCGAPVTEESARIHHFKTRKSGGTNRYDIQGTLCKRCHTAVVTENLALAFDSDRYPDTRAAGRLMQGRYLLETELKKLGWPMEVRYGYETKVKREELNLPKSHVNDAAALGARKGYSLRLPPVLYKIEYRKRHSNRKLFNANPGVVHYRGQADRQSHVDQSRMKVDDHDQETNRKNRSYRRHVRNKYYKRLKAEGRFNFNLLPGKKRLNEPYAVNEAVYVDKEGRPAVVKNQRIWRDQDLSDLPPSRKLFEKGDIVRTKEGELAQIISLKSAGMVKILFVCKQEGRKNQATDRNPKYLVIVQKGRGRVWKPEKAALPS